jgi:hypothetical protein
VYYWRTPSANSFGRHSLIHALTGEVLGERPPLDGLRVLRKRVLLLLGALADATLSRADALCLIATLRSSRDAWVLLDVLRVLMEWLTPDRFGSLPNCGRALLARLAELAEAGEETMYDSLIDLMHGDAELLRLAALRTYGLLLAAVPLGP